MKTILISSIISFVIGFFACWYFLKQKDEIKVPIHIEIQPKQETEKKFKELPIEVTNRKQQEKLDMDEDEEIHHRRYKSGDTEVYLTATGLITGVKIDSVIFKPKPIIIDSVLTVLTNTDSLSTQKLIVASIGSGITGGLIAKENYSGAVIAGCVTFGIVYFYDQILNLWRIL